MTKEDLFNTQLKELVEAKAKLQAIRQVLVNQGGGLSSEQRLTAIDCIEKGRGGPDGRKQVLDAIAEIIAAQRKLDDLKY
jgi:hypothetical protein